MYYLNCVDATIKSSPFPAKLTNYQNYENLTETGRRVLVKLVEMLKPQNVKTFIVVDNFPKRNQFFELKQETYITNLSLNVASTLVVNGTTVRSSRFMICTMERIPQQLIEQTNVLKAAIGNMLLGLGN